MSHTALPWKVVSDPHFDTGNVYTSIQPVNVDEEAMKPLAMASGEHHVCRMHHTAAPWRFNYHRANAAFIVEACNSYHETRVSLAAKDAEIAKLREALTEWRPIETAPKDGTLIILHDSVRVASGVGRWRQVSSRDTLKDIDGLAQFSRQYGWRSASDKSIENATHWMPLPDAPKGGAA